MQKVLYWQDVLGNSEDLNQYQGIISKLLNGDYKEGDLEKLAGHNVYSVRVNKSDRLLFSTVTVKGKSCLLLLDVVLNHDYHKSRFLKPQVLRQFLEQNVLKALAKEELAFVKADALPPLWANPQSKEEEEAIQFQKVTFYNQTFITLSDAQEKALKTQLPAVISGAAGSGKSCVALAILEQAVTQFIYAPEKPLLYITQSANLAQTLQRMWEQLPASQTEAGKQVQFLTYQQFIEQQAKELKDKKAQDKASFMTWLNHYIGSYNNKAKAAKKILAKEFQDFLKNTESIYQAFRYLSGFLPENPQGISARHDQFKNDHERQWLIEAYANYKKSHDDEKNTGFNPEFHTLKQQNLYDLIVVDEAQDLSGLQLKNLRRAAQNGQIAYCMDSNQSLIDPVSQRPLLVSEGANHIELPVTYRCPGHVVKVANAILDLKQRVTGGLADKLEYSRIILSDEQINNPGIVEWIEPNELNKHPHLKQLAQTTQFAVVTLPQFKEKAKELFGTPLVFTPEEIKGLEYPHIVLYRLFDDPVFGKANKIITPITTKTEPHRAKAGQGDESFAPPFNQVFTACTRPTESLTFVEDSSANRLNNSAHQLNNIIPPIKQLIKNLNNPNNNNNNNSIDHKTTAPASAQDWNNEAIRLRQLGKIEQANAIEKVVEKNLKKHPEKGENNDATPQSRQKNNPFKALVEAVVKAAEEETPLKHPDSNKLNATFSQAKQIWLGTPVRHYPNLLVYALNHHKAIEKALAPVSFTAICVKFLTVERLSSPYRESDSDVTRSFLHYLCEKRERVPFRCLTLLDIPEELWTKKITQGLHVSSPFFHLIANCPDLLPIIADKIPLEKWFEEYPGDQGFVTPWVQLTYVWMIAKSTRAYQHVTSALEKISRMALTKPPFSPEQLCRKNTTALPNVEVPLTLLQALALSQHGCHLLQQYLNKYPEFWAKIPPAAWFEVHEPALVSSAIESLICNSHDFLDQFIDRYPDLPDLIPPSILSRNNSCLLEFCVQENTFFTWLLTKNPNLLEKISPAAWFKPGFANSTPLFWFSTTPKGRQLLLLILEKNPQLIDDIPANTWIMRLTKTPKNGIGDKSIVYWLLQDKTCYRLLDLLADKLVGRLSMGEWYAHLAPVITHITAYLYDLSYHGGHAAGLVFFMQLFDTWGQAFPSDDPLFKQVNELLIRMKSRTRIPTPVFASPASPLLFTPAKTPSLTGQEEQTASMELQH